MLNRALAMGLEEREYKTVVDLLGREPTDLELAIFALNWSEHCSYKSSKRFLKRLPSLSERTIKGPGAGAGVLALDEETVVAFKIESHNHPSAVEPKHGAATGVGGIVRDVLSMGVRPVALLDSLRFGDFRKSKKSLQLLKGVVDGIAWYGNSIGVPVVGGEVFVSDTYEDNPLVNVMCVGIGKRKHVKDGVLKGVGNSVLLVGAPTGPDGIMGASFASQTFEGDISENRPAIQIGDPFMEKLLIEATLEAVELPQVLGIQDLGAGGLSTALPEMAYKGGVGVELYTDKVPTRGPLTPYEVVLSESQERMVLCVERGKEKEVIDIYEKWGLTAAVIGEVMEEKVFRIKDGQNTVAEIPLGILFSGLPVPEWIADEKPLSLWDYMRIVSKLIKKYESARRNRRKLKTVLHMFGLSTYPVGNSTGVHWASREIEKAIILGEREKDKKALMEDYKSFLNEMAKYKKDPEEILEENFLKRVALKVLSHPNVASKRWIYRQYDYMVGTDTVVGPGMGDSAVIRIKGKNYALAVTVDGGGKYLAMDPYWGAQKVAFEATLNVTLSGGEVIGFTDGVNFPSPADPDTYYSLQKALRGLEDFSRYFGIPVVSGNVSLYNETEGKKIFPTLIVGAVGIVRDTFSIPRVGVDREGLEVYSIGFPASHFDLGGSEFLSELLEEFSLGWEDENTLYRYYNKPDPHNCDLHYLKVLVSAIYELIASGLVVNAHDVSEGGMFSSLAEMVILGDKGIRAEVEDLGELFSETVPKVVVTTFRPVELERFLNEIGIPYRRIGKTLKDRVLRVKYYKDKEIVLSKEELDKAYYSTYEVDNGGV